jgi:N6-adenosine-specific RNA methylase IME4
VPTAVVAPRPVSPPQETSPAAATAQRSNTEVSWDIASFKTANYSRKVLGIFAERFGLKVEDMSEDGGNLWVRTDDSHLGINGVLLKWGFEFKNARKGWWWRGR